MNITIMVPSLIVGGVSTTFHGLHRGLTREGFYIKLLKIGGPKTPLLSGYCCDLLQTKNLMDSDLVLYIGGIPWPSHIIARSKGIPVALFLHGYVYHELSQIILHEKGLRKKIGSAIILTMLRTAVLCNTINLYICRSQTIAEVNKVSNFVILPQWKYPEDFEFSRYRGIRRNGAIRIVTYTSIVESPRLLSYRSLSKLVHIIEHLVRRQFEFVIIDPKERFFHTSSVKTRKPLTRQNFLSFLASSDLYLERNIDEELGHTALEAMCLGVPVAKLTHPRYWDRQDYGDENLILARSFRELSEKIAEYINNVEHYYDHYSVHGRKFIETKRTWNAVKGPFLTTLRHLN